MSGASEWQWWQDALAGRHAPIDVNTPETGYYRIKSRDKLTWLPVAYWRKDGALRCRVNGTEILEGRAMEMWPWASKNPITYEVYTAVVEGAPWPDLHEAVTRSNNAPAEDSFEAIKERIEDLAREADKLIGKGAASTQDACDQAADLANELGKYWKRADAARAAEKRPHDEAAAAVQRKWSPLLTAGEVYKRLKAVVVTPFQVAAEKKAKEESAAAVAAGANPETLPQRRTTAGTRGRGVALRSIKVADITDYTVLWTHLKEHPEIKETVERIANASARANVELPGMKIKTEQKAA